MPRTVELGDELAAEGTALSPQFYRIRGWTEGAVQLSVRSIDSGLAGTLDTSEPSWQASVWGDRGVSIKPISCDRYSVYPIRRSVRKAPICSSTTHDDDDENFHHHHHHCGDEEA